MIGLLPWWVRWAVLGVTALGAYGLGRHHQAEADDLAQSRQEAANARALAAWVSGRVRRAHELAASFEADRAALQTRTRTLTRYAERIVERPVYRDCQLDADGLRLIQSADRGDLPAAAPEPGR